MRVLVTGTHGQLARSLLTRGRELAIEVVALGRPEIDLSQSDDLTAAIAAAEADAVVHAAAYTAVDRAESEPNLAEAINGRGAGLVAIATAKLGLPVLHMSTDYVFDGASRRPYSEDDPTAPLNAYGKSKLAGERAIAAANHKHVILRTSWVYAPFGKNFVRTMMRLAETRDEIAVVSDQRGVPNYALDIADGTLAIVQHILTARNERILYGTFHLTAAGETNWAEFASEIFSISRKHGGPSARVRAISSSEYLTAAQRPAYSCLDCSRLAEIHHIQLPDWRLSLERCVVQLLSAENRG